MRLQVEERAARGAAAVVADLAASLSGWLPGPLRRARPAEPQLPPPDACRPLEQVVDDATRAATSFLLAPRYALSVSEPTCA